MFGEDFVDGGELFGEVDVFVYFEGVCGDVDFLYGGCVCVGF